MTMRAHPMAQRRYLLCVRVSRSAPSFRGFTKQQLELAFLTAARLYTRGPVESPMTDFAYDALVKKVVVKPSPYLRMCVDIKALKKTGSTVAIRWDEGIAELCDMMFRPRWKPSDSDEHVERKLIKRLSPEQPSPLISTGSGSSGTVQTPRTEKRTNIVSAPKRMKFARR